MRHGGIEFGDRLLMLNGVSVKDVSHDHILDMMRAATSLVLLLRHDPTDLVIHTDAMQQVGEVWTDGKERKEHPILAWEVSRTIKGTNGAPSTVVRTGGLEIYKEHGLPGVRVKPDRRGEVSKKTKQLAPTLRPHDILLQIKLGGEKVWRSVIGMDSEQVRQEMMPQLCGFCAPWLSVFEAPLGGVKPLWCSCSFVSGVFSMAGEPTPEAK